MAPFYALGVTILMIGLLQYFAPDPSILEFEFAGSIGDAKQLMEEWGEEGRQAARRQTYLDFLFLLSYPVTLCLFILRVARQQPDGLRQFGITLGGMQFVAGALDAIENISLLKMLDGSMSSIYPLIAYYGAAGKFLIVIGGIVFLIIGTILNLGSKE